VIVAAADFVELLTEVAVSAAVAGLGAALGAVYVADVDVTFESIPHADPEHPLPESAQVTPSPVGSFGTAAVNACDAFTLTVADCGVIETEIGAGVSIVIVAAADFVASETDVAVSVTLEGSGADAGAVYITDVDVTAESDPHVAPEQPAPESVQVTPLFAESFDTFAANACVPPTFTVADDGLTATEIDVATPVAGANATACITQSPLVINCAVA
jgi:hypothetical protein